MTPSEAAQQILQHANAAGLSPKNWADKFNKFNPKQSTKPMRFDPDSVTPSNELLEECISNPGSVGRDCTLAARWGARKAVEALRHQWPEPIADRPPTEEDGDCDGYVQLLYAGKWSIAAWHVVADTYSDWLHTPSWRPKPEPTLKQQALEIVKHVFPCTPEQAETLLAALALIPDAPDAPDTTP